MRRRWAILAVAAAGAVAVSAGTGPALVRLARAAGSATPVLHSVSPAQLAQAGITLRPASAPLLCGVPGLGGTAACIVSRTAAERDADPGAGLRETALAYVTAADAGGLDHRLAWVVVVRSPAPMIGAGVASTSMMCPRPVSGMPVCGPRPMPMTALVFVDAHGGRVAGTAWLPVGPVFAGAPMPAAPVPVPPHATGEPVGVPPG